MELLDFHEAELEVCLQHLSNELCADYLASLFLDLVSDQFATADGLTILCHVADNLLDGFSLVDFELFSCLRFS